MLAHLTVPYPIVSVLDKKEMDIRLFLWDEAGFFFTSK
jgi:hypothetical protein